MSIEVVFEKQIINGEIHREVDVEQRRQYFLLVCLAALCVLGLLFYGWQQYRWIQLGYDIEDAQKKKADLVEYQHELLLERDSLAADERIDSIARTKLGMVVAHAGQIVMLASGDPWTLPPAQPEDSVPLSAAKR